MKNKFKMMLLCALCVICLQVSLTAYAFEPATDHDFESPLDPLPGTESTSVTPDGSPAEQSSKAADKITSDISNPRRFKLKNHRQIRGRGKIGFFP